MTDTEKLIKTPENYSALASTDQEPEEIDQDLQPKRQEQDSFYHVMVD